MVLPTPLTSFIGREEELLWLTQKLSSTRLLTITGPGGVGKTRLALQTAASQGDTRTVFVDLAPLRDPRLVLPAISQALALPEQGDGPPLLERLAHLIGESRLLLLLDNFEQIVAGASDVARLVALAPRLTVLVTSRLPLHVAGEQEFPLSPLPVAPTKAGEDALLMDSPAVRLFVQRAQAVRPDYSFDAGTAPTIAAICRALDGLPLAIELAATRVRTHSPRALLNLLGQRLPLLSGGPRDVPARQRTLRAAVAWSEELLDDPERQLFRRLAVFPGGATIEMAQAVCVDSSVSELALLERLTTLVEHNLLRAQDEAGGPRYRMLETVREYAAEQLLASYEAPELWRRAIAYLAALGEQARATWRSSTYSGMLDRIAAEQDNFREALTHALEENDSLAAYQLGAGIWQLWYLRTWVSEGQAWLERILALPPPQSAAPEQERVLVSLRAFVLFGLAANASQRGDARQAEPLTRQALALYRQVEDEEGIIYALTGLGVHFNDEGEFERAADYFTEALAIRRRIGSPGGLSLLLQNLGTARLFQGDYSEAYGLFTEALAIQREIGDRTGMAGTLQSMGTVVIYLGHLGLAWSLLRQSLTLARSQGLTMVVHASLESLALLYERAGQSRTALQLLAASEARRQQLGLTLSPSRHTAVVETVLSARSRLGAMWTETWAEGLQLTLEVLVALVDEGPPGAEARQGPTASAPASDLPRGQGGEPLTTREMEVLNLLALGMPNKTIAEQLVVSAHTVQSHIKAIFGKLGVTTRAAATRVSIEQGLVTFAGAAPLH